MSQRVKHRKCSCSSCAVRSSGAAVRAAIRGRTGAPRAQITCSAWRSSTLPSRRRPPRTSLPVTLLRCVTTCRTPVSVCIQSCTKSQFRRVCLADVLAFLSHSQPSNQLQKGKMEGPPPSPKPGMPNQAGLPAVVPSSPSLKHRPSSQMPSAHNGAKQGHYQGNGATMGQQPLGGRTDIGNAPYPGRTPGLHAQSGRSLTSPYDHGYFSIGSNAGPGSHESFESCIPRITPPPEEQSSNDKVLQYLGQQSGHPRMGAQNQGVGVMPGRQGMPGHLSAGTGSSGTMPQFNTQMPPQQQLPQHGPPDQMFNYRAPPQQQQQPHHMRGVTPHYNQGPGADGFNYTPRTPKTNLQGTPFSSQTSQGFNFEHPMSQRYSSSFGNNPYYGQSQMGQQTPRGVNGYGGQGSAGMMHGATGGAYPNFGSNQSSPDGYERSSMSRAKKQRLDNNAYQSKPQGLQYEPPTTLRQPLVDMKNARMLSSVRPHPSQGPGTMQQQQQGNHMYPGSVHTPHQHHMRGQYPQFNQQHVQQNQFQQRSQGVYGPQTPGYMGQMPANSQMQQGPNTHHQPHNGPPMNPTPMQNSANCGNKPGMSVSQSYASLQAQLPPYQPGTQDFVQHLVTDRLVKLDQAFVEGQWMSQGHVTQQPKFLWCSFTFSTCDFVICLAVCRVASVLLQKITGHTEIFGFGKIFHSHHDCYALTSDVKWRTGDSTQSGILV